MVWSTFLVFMIKYQKLYVDLAKSLDVHEDFCMGSGTENRAALIIVN